MRPARFRLLIALALALALALAPAQAQMDPRWRTTTDLTDLFREAAGPSEVLWVLDFSPASSCVMWHPYYHTGADYWTNFRSPVRTRDYPRGDPDLDCVCFRYSLAWTAPGGYALTVRACWSDGGRDHSGAYPFYGMAGPLVAADGAVIDQAFLRARHESLPTSSASRDGSIGDPATWVKYATHARLHTDGRSGFPFSAYCGADVALAGPGRTIDLPLPWRLLESPAQVLEERYDDLDRGGYPGFASFVYANRSRPAWADGTDRAPGPAPAPELGHPGHVDAGHPRAEGVLAVVGGRPILYHTDYLFWIFFGTAGTPSRKDDASRPTAMVPTAAHVIPQVTEPNRKGRTATAWDNGLPARCRYQAVQAALLSAWWGTLPGGGRVRDHSRWAFRYLDPAGEEAPGRIGHGNDLGRGRERSLRLLAEPGERAALLRKAPGHDPGRGAAGAWAVANALAQYDATALAGDGASVFDPGHTRLAEAPCGASLLVLVAAGGGRWDPGALPGSLPSGRITARGRTRFPQPRLVEVWAIGAGLGGEGLPGQAGPGGGAWAGTCLDAPHGAALDQAMARVAEAAMYGHRWAESGCLARLAVGDTAYLGLFHPTGRSPRWRGDLLMTGLADSGAGAVPVDRDGRPLGQGPEALADGAIWAASRLLAGYGTADRRQGRVYTLLPGAGRLVPVTPGDPALLGALKQAMPPDAQPSDALLTRCLWSMLGGDPARAETRGPGSGSYPMRPDAMGDIINSTPALLGYPAEWAERVPELAPQLAAAQAAGARPRFRVLFAGTNQGHLHAFGELSYAASGAVPGQPVRAAAVELWSFIPTEAILNPWYLDDLDVRGAPNRRPSPHPSLVDAPPLVYFNPRGRAGPPGLCRPGDTALLVAGLGKGGRSTYCLDLADPLRPAFKWALRPDEVTPAGNPAVRAMGFATSRPTIARALDGAGRVTDFLVLGGGLSSAELERERPWSAGDPPPPFGRSILLFDVNQGPGDYRTGPGTVLSYGHPAMASVAAGAAPLERFPGSGLAQRIYWADREGAVWALAGAPDSSRVADWKLRPVFRPRAGTVVSTVPEVFTLPGGRVPGTSTPAVAVVLGTGDRNNPMDEPSAPGPGAGAKLPPNRLLLLFDPQDPARFPAGLGEGELVGLPWAGDGAPGPGARADASLPPGRLGFSLELPPAQSPRRAQVLHDPLVAHGALFFSVFSPGADPQDPCARTGRTETFRFARAWRPEPAGGARLEGARFAGLAGELRATRGGWVEQTGVRLEPVGAGPGQVIRSRLVLGSGSMRILSWRDVP